MENIEKQNLELIAQMIKTARNEYQDDSDIYLIWGWAVSLACIAQYLLLRMGKDGSGIVWLVALPAAFVMQAIVYFTKKRKEKVKTHNDKIIGYVWIAVGICIGIVLSSAGKLQESTSPILIMLYGVGTFVSGGIMRFRPMILGALCCWVISFISFWVNVENQLLLLPLSLMLSYIIPGHLLKNHLRKNV